MTPPQAALSKWFRARSMWPGATLFGASPDPTDILQGNLGDCWFLSALSALAEYPDRIRALFASDYSPSGAIAANVYVRGIRRVVVVDDFLPFRPTNVTYYTNRGSDRAIWVPILEKVYSKVVGQYEGIIAGESDEAFAFLTGFATDKYISA